MVFKHAELALFYPRLDMDFINRCRSGLLNGSKKWNCILRRIYA